MLLTAAEQTQRAHDLALSHNLDASSRRGWTSALRRFDDDSSQLQQFCRRLRQESHSGWLPSEEWLIDHVDFLAEQTTLVQESLTAKLYRKMPSLSGSATPRALDLCLAYLESTDGLWDVDSFVAFTNAYQQVLTLTLAEVWGLEWVLRMAVIERLFSHCVNVIKRREAESWVDERLSADRSGSPTFFADLQRGLDASGPQVAALTSRMRGGTDDADVIRVWLHNTGKRQGVHVDDLVREQFRQQSRVQVGIGSLVTALRSINRIDWSKVCEQVSVVDRVLSSESTGDYTRLDASSRNSVRKRVERIAARWGIAEHVVATEAVALANDVHSAVSNDAHDAPPPRSAFVGFYVLDVTGMRQLRRRLRGYVPADATVVRPGSRNERVYFSLLGVTFVLVTWFMSAIALGFQSVSLWGEVAVIGACLLPASEWAVAFSHWLVECTIKPIPLLRYDFSAEIPKAARTMVVVPVIWSSPKEVLDVVERLELHHLATRQDNVQYAVLGDFADADRQHVPSDDPLLSLARERLQVLNRAYGDPDRFLMFHRRRVWNESERRWMGWERKRGKLVEFVELMRGRLDTTYQLDDIERDGLDQVKYIVTLDTDTELPLGALSRLVGTIHLPYNRPRLNQNRTRVVEGYGILQPRVGVRYDATTRSWLARLWAGNPGVDPYAFALSDPYQDAFGQGIFTGKGIFDVDAFYNVLCPRIPDNCVLSHDLLEGGFLRAGLLSDVEVIDDYPSTFASYQSRFHRWVRGDWQLLRWLRVHAYNRLGERQRVDLSVLTRWQIVDNLRRSLLHPALFCAVLLGLTVLPGAGWRWLTIAGVTLAIPLVRHCASVSRLIHHPSGIGLVATQTLVTALLLPVQVAVLLDAIVRTLVRLVITRRGLLEWVSSAEVERRGAGKRRRRMDGLPLAYALMAVLLAVAWIYGSGMERALASILVGFWVLAPVYAILLDRTPFRRRRPLAEPVRSELAQLAKDTWRFYADYAGESDHYLPPDNVQIDPPVGVAHRTSSTNIGMLLTAYVSAADLGLISRGEAIRGLRRTLGTVERLEKWHGHLLNWYDTQTLASLSPRYVSTVDSGNWVASLMVTNQALEEWLTKDPLETPAHAELRALMDQIDALVIGTDFRPLFDQQAGLFTLGYHVDADRRETILYDLMASEARQASFVAIALGQVPASHWFQLNRTMTRAGGHPTLLSWSGTMFEYFMPAMLMRTYRGTLWDSTYRGVRARQVEYAKTRGVPYGISESGYYAFDHQMNYQYRAFGVPGLGFKRGLEQDLVIAPYAAVLTLPFDIEAAYANLQSLERLGLRGEYGFFEAMDFTADRMPPERSSMPIQSYMAHHQGMILLALTNVLCDDIMVERFHRDLRVRAAQLLLQERLPVRPRLIPNPASVVSKLPVAKTPEIQAARHFDRPADRAREACVLSNGRLTSVVDTLGGGCLTFDDLHVNRWRDDPLSHQYGQFIYVRDGASGETWSPSVLPAGPDHTHVVEFARHEARFTSTSSDVSVLQRVCVSADSDAELRIVRVQNRGVGTRRLEVTTYQEVALAPLNADAAHLAFSKLFVETEFDADSACLVAHRRRRKPEDVTHFLAQHWQVLQGEALGGLSYGTNRASFVGRGHAVADPEGLSRPLDHVVGAVVDPALIQRHTLELGPGEEGVLVLVTAVADQRDRAIQLATQFGTLAIVDRTFDLAWHHVRIEEHHLALPEGVSELADRLVARVFYPGPRSQAQQTATRHNVLGQSSLWSLGISGDLPIVFMQVSDTSESAFVATAIRAHHVLQRARAGMDLVLLAGEPGGYLEGLCETLRQLVAQDGDSQRVGQSGGVFILPADQLDEAQVTLLRAVARVTLDPRGPSLAQQLRVEPRPVADRSECERYWPAPRATVALGVGARPTSHGGRFENGAGRFSEEGSAYRISLAGDEHLPLPWSNVIANPNFGTLVTELGTGYTWWRNSREFKLTPWRNDPVTDKPSEVLYIRDEQSGAFWSATPAPIRVSPDYEVEHGFGYTEFQHAYTGILHRLTVFTAHEDDIKVSRLTLENDANEERTLSITYFADWVLGVDAAHNTAQIVSAWDEDAQALLATNTLQETFRGGTAACGLRVIGGSIDERPSWTSDAGEFIGLKGDLRDPAGMHTTLLSNHAHPSPQTCAAIRVTVTIRPRSQCTIVALLGCADDRDTAVRCIEKYSNLGAVERALDAVKRLWHDVTGQVHVQTPSEPLNLMQNGWLLYQTVSSRLWGRTGFYQAGGAFGFRDQLQDALALLHAKPTWTRAQLLLHARHQYVEGDVEHWWHEETGKGIRTRFSDDLLWLPYAVSRYVEHTGDVAVLSEMVPYLEAPPLADGEDERYGDTVVSATTGTLYEHCLRAVDKSSARGEHGLPLMGSGDWNDGMNLVGPKGRGESVWLAWFLSVVLVRMTRIADMMGDADTGARYEADAIGLKESIEQYAWDGQWYRRAYTDEGTWIGSATNAECRIDAIAQSWSVIAGGTRPPRQALAMASFERELIEPTLNIARLLTPPFDTSAPSPGYIQGYPPGLRENGGQYTHGTVWSIQALAMLGNGNHALRLYERLAPVTHAQSATDVARYQGEPYVMAADVYSAGPLAGRAGWTWYTGAAGWMYQVGLEWILGVRRRADRLLLEPCLPDHWPGFNMTYRFGRSTYAITVERAHDAPRILTVDGMKIWEADESTRQSAGLEPAQGGRVVNEGVGVNRESAVHGEGPVSASKTATAVNERPLGLGADAPCFRLLDDGKHHTVLLRY